MSDEFDAPRVGVYICHCGSNIAGTVNVKAVSEYAKKLPNVVVSRAYKYMCSDPGQTLIKEDIKHSDVNRVVVASCSPLLHEETFRKACEEAGINQFYFQMVNIREHDSWVHKEEMERATEKAKDLVSAAVLRVVRHQPLTKKRIPVNPNVLVVGAGIAGIHAATTIANAGKQVYLVEREPTVGGNMAKFDKTFPTLDCSACILTPKMTTVGNHPNIKLLTYSEVEKLEGFVGNFEVTVKKKARSVDESKCTGCGVCYENCPVLLQPQIPKKPENAPPVRDQEYIDGLIAKHSQTDGPLVQIMLGVNEKYRYLPKDVLKYLSYKLDIPLSTIYRVATFYKAFSLEMRGKYHIKVCMGTACHVRGARNLADKIRTAIEDAEDGLYSFETVNCLGACALGPVMVVNEDVHGHVSVDKVDKILSSLGGA